jgi:hypothetical protein
MALKPTMGRPIDPSQATLPRLYPSPEVCLSIDVPDVFDPLMGSILDDPASVDVAEDFFLSPPLEPVSDLADDRPFDNDQGTVVSASEGGGAPESAVDVADSDDLGDFLLDAVAWL